MTAGTKARLFAAGFGMAGVSFAIVGGLGYAARAGCGNAHDTTACGLMRRIGVGGAAGLVLVPMATAGAVSLTGRGRGHRDRFGRTYLGAFGGTLLGAGVAILSDELLAQEGVRTKPRVGVSVALGLATLSGTTTIAFWASDRRLARLAPVVLPQPGGAALGLGGRF